MDTELGVRFNLSWIHKTCSNLKLGDYIHIIMAGLEELKKKLAPLFDAEK